MSAAAAPPRDAASASIAALGRLLDSDAPTLRDRLPPGFADTAERYVDLLLQANERINLTRVVEPDEVARLHLLDALAVLPMLPALGAGGGTARGIDLGSGGGVPGLVLAIARPDVRWMLVDSVRKKADALRAFVGNLGLENVDVSHERAEALGRGGMREAADVVTARACAALPVLAEYALPLLHVGGRLLAWKGPIGAEELAAGAIASRMTGGGDPAVEPTRIAALGEHRFVVVPKVRTTPARYPRRPGEPAKRPLA